MPTTKFRSIFSVHENDGQIETKGARQKSKRDFSRFVRRSIRTRVRKQTRAGARAATAFFFWFYTSSSSSPLPPPLSSPPLSPICCACDARTRRRASKAENLNAKAQPRATANRHKSENRDLSRFGGDRRAKRKKMVSAFICLLPAKCKSPSTV